MTEHGRAQADFLSPLHRLGHIIGAVLIAVGLTGYFVGLHPGAVAPVDARAVLDESAVVVDTDHVPVALSYREMADRDLSVNAEFASRLPVPAADPGELFIPVELTAERRHEAVDHRAERRAFSGAPPVVPHQIDHRNTEACLVCHGQGLKVGSVVAPRISHQTLTNCTQCHVESTNLDLPPNDRLRVGASRFEGMSSPGPGERAWPGAPPIIPHTTWMRENCASCHGLVAQQGLRTSHPWRFNCTQCHAPSAQLDQVTTVSNDRPPIAIPPELAP